MRFRYVHILAALFFIVGMAVQFFVYYGDAGKRVQERIDWESQMTQDDLLFELYDVYDVIDQLKTSVKENLSQPDMLFKNTRTLLNRYPSFSSCYVAFRENYYPEKGKYFCPCSYRVDDTVKTIKFGDNKDNYFEREWYKGALQSGKKGFWSQPYLDEDFEETIFTCSDDMRDEEGNLIGVLALDFSVSWLQHMLEKFKPSPETICALYSSNGSLLAASGNLRGIDPSRLKEDDWILSRQTIDPIDIELVIAFPKRLIRTGVLRGILLPFAVFLLGIMVVGIFIRRILRDQQKNAQLETEKKVLSHELHIAHGIQMGILRKEVPDGEDITVHATLLPMREVGGDLYDFSRRGDVLWFIVGDVSGKGVPAAMFMSATVNLFRSALCHQSSPKAIMEEMNAVLSDNNPSLTFVTAFVGRLHIPIGQLLYCNAAHVPPLVQGVDSSVRSIRMNPNIPLGYDGKFKFTEEGCMLGEDERLVLYTDGVTEARNVARKMMGLKRWKEIVAHGGYLLDAVKQYIGEAEPTDDITIMTICKKSAVQPMSLRVPNNKDQWPLLRRTLHEYGLCVGLEPRTLKKLEVALEEAVVNIMNYSQATEIGLTISQDSSAQAISIQLTDNGVPFDPTAMESDTSKAINERQLGGLGISLMRQIADELLYQHTDEGNQLILIKKI